MISSSRKTSTIAGALLFGGLCCLFWLWSPGAPPRLDNAVMPPPAEVRVARTPVLVAESLPGQGEPERVVQAPSTEVVGVGAGLPEPEAVAEPVPETEHFRGQVIDIETGAPIVDAEVRTDRRPVARTNGEGCFEFDVVPGAGAIGISADGYGYEMRFLANVPLLQRRTECGYLFELFPGASVHGTVVDNHGAPITQGSVLAYDEGAHAYLYGSGSARALSQDNNLYTRDCWSGVLSTGADLDWIFVQRSTAEIDEAGRFSLRDVAAGEPMHLLVWAENVLREFEAPIVLEPGQVAEVELTVERAAIVRGSVTLPPGAQTAGVGFCFHEKKHWPHFVVTKRDRWVPIQEDGSYTSGPLWPCDEMHVEVSCTLHHASGRWERVVREWTISLEAEAVIELDLDLTGRN